MSTLNKDFGVARKLIAESKRIAIIPSTPVDADAICSSLALGEILQDFQKNVTIFYSSNRISRFQFLGSVESIKVTDVFSVDLSEFDLIVFLDGSEKKVFYDNQIHTEEWNLPEDPVSLVIDHHSKQKSFTKHSLIDEAASSASEIVYKLLANGMKLSASVATKLLAGISEDTDHFRHNTSAETLRIASDLVRLGADKENIILNFFRTDDFKVIRLTGSLISEIKINEKMQYAYLGVPESKWKFLKISYDLFKRAIFRLLMDEMVSIDGTDFCYSVFEKEPGVFAGSFRSRIQGKMDLSLFAKKLGGGGHVNSSGFLIKANSADEVTQAVNNVIDKHYENAKRF